MSCFKNVDYEYLSFTINILLTSITDMIKKYGIIGTAFLMKNIKKFNQIKVQFTHE